MEANCIFATKANTYNTIKLNWKEEEIDNYHNLTFIYGNPKKVLTYFSFKYLIYRFLLVEYRLNSLLIFILFHI